MADEVIISRRITGTRSVARINGELVSLAVLRQAAALLIDIHGQHEHQSLLHKDKHLAILASVCQGRNGTCQRCIKRQLQGIYDIEERDGRGDH